MKICFIGDGNSDHTQVIANYFAENNEVHLIGYRFRDNYHPKICIHRLSKTMPKMGYASNYLSFLLWIFEVRKLIRTIEPDLVNVHYITTYGLLTSLIKFHPMVATAWGSDILIQPRTNLFWRHVVKSVLKKTDLFTCLFSVDMLRNDIGKLVPVSLPMVSLPHGIDTNLFRRSNEGNNLRRFYGIKDTEPVVINIRGSNPVFDPTTFIRAIPIVLDIFPEVIFLAAYEKDNRKPYEDLIRALHIEKNIIILDWMSSEEVAKHLAMADIYVSTSLSDGASNALFEGMACELAPVVTDIPANRFWIKNEENGFLVKPKDHNALAEKIICLLCDKEKAKLFGEKCRKIIQDNVEYKTQMAKTQRIYQELVEKYSKKIK